MTGSLSDRARGLVDSHELAEAPGALTVAEGVVVEPGGSLAVRPTFSLLTAVSTTRKPRTLISYGGAWAAVDDDAGTLRLRTAATATISGAMVLPSNVDETPWLVSRGSLYVSTSLGWRKITSTGDSASEAAGIEAEIVHNRLVLMGAVSGTGPEAPPWTGLVAYRLVVRREDANGYVRRSKPSARYATQGNLIGGVDVLGAGTSRYYIRGIVAGDVVEWYRTRDSGAVTISPAASHYLVCEYTITSTDVSNGYFNNTATQFDVTADDALGAALYTNPEREGIAKAKYEPPIARAAAIFGRCAWYADTTSKHRLIGSLRHVGHVIEFQGNTTIGLATITGVASSAGLEVGQYVCDSNSTPKSTGTHFAARTRIISITGAGPYTVTVSANASATTAGVGFGACNWIEPSMVARYSVTTAVLTAGLFTFTIINATGLEEGMYVWDQTGNETPFSAGTYFAASTKITTIAGAGPYTITVDKAILATSPGVETIRFGDYVTINGRDFVGHPSAGGYGPGTPYINRTRTFAISNLDTIGTSIFWLAQAVNLDSVLTNQAYRMIPTSGESAYGALTTGDFAIEEFGLGGSALTMAGNVLSLSTLAWWPSLETTRTSSNDAATNRVAWSATDEPEAVPLPNYVDLATSSARVQRVISLRASMLVFTTEGLYRISGVPQDAWAADLIDPSLVLVSRNAADVIDNVCYAWTTRGVVRVDESGFVDVSTGAIGKRLDVYARQVAASGFHVWLATWRAAHLVLVGCGTDATNGETTEVFAFNTLSNAWTSWPLQIRRAQEIGSTLYTVRGDRYDVQTSDGTSLGHDRTHAIAAWTYTAGATTVDILAADYAPWRPRVGDYLRATIGGVAQFRRVVSYTFVSGTTYRFGLSRAFTSATISALVGYEVAAVDVEWTPATAGALMGSTQRWREAVVTLDASQYVASATIPSEIEPGFGGETSSVGDTMIRKLMTISAVRDLPIRFAVTRSLARASLLRPRLKLSIVGWAARIFGITMQRSEAGPRVHR